MCDKDVMKPKSLITYEFLVKEAMNEYRDLVDSNLCESIDNN